MRILIVDADAAMSHALKGRLEDDQHECTITGDGGEAWRLAMRNPHDAIVLDRVLPSEDGISLVRRFRGHGNQTPILIVSTMDSIDARVEALEAGADDYLTKPFAYAELVARIRAVSRRSGVSAPQTLNYRDLTLNVSSRRAVRDGIELNLTPTEFSILELLVRNAGQDVSRQKLCAHLWPANWDSVSNLIDVHISRLRVKLDRRFPSKLLHTVRGVGYRLEIMASS